MKHNYTRILQAVVFSAVALFATFTASEIKAQTISSYTFASTSGTYAPITGGTVVASGQYIDDPTYNTLPIGFTFTYHGVNYTTVSVAGNGHMSIGTTAYCCNYSPNVLNTTANTVAAFARDLYSGPGAEARYQTIGTTPNRVFVFQVTNWGFYSSALNEASWQYRLYETTNAVEIVYGNAPGTSSQTVQVGLTGATATDFNARTTTTSWASSTAAGTNTATMTFNSSVKPSSGLTYTWTPPSGCTGTPATPTIAGPASACASTNFTLTASGFESAGNMAFQWQVSTVGAGGPFNNVPGQTFVPSATVSQTVASWYRLVSSCLTSSISSTSNVIAVAMNAPINCYCTTGIASFTGDEEILNVTVNGASVLNQTSTCATLAPGPGSINQRYSNYTTLTPTNVNVGSSVSFSVNVGTCGGNYPSGTAIFIDWNADGDFTDAGEKVFATANTTSGPHLVSGSFMVPLTATLGVTGMRVMNAEGYCETGCFGSTITPCLNYGWGETEDYHVNVQTVPPCIGTPSAGVNAQASPSLVCSSTSFTLSTTSAPSSSPGISYQWESFDGAAWNPIAGATNPTHTMSGQTVTTQYRLNVTCSNSGLSAQSGSVTVTQDAATNCYCTPVYSFGNTAGDFINSVQLNTLSNLNTGPNATPFTYYSNGGTPWTNLDEGSAYTLQVTVGTYSFNDVAAWVDFNADGDFSDAGELLGQVNDQPANTQVNINFTVPAGVVLGNTRLRVREADQGGTIPSCGTLTFGETEDYLITLTQLTACSSMPAGGTTVNSDASPCSGIPFTLSVTGSPYGTLGQLALQWQISTTGAGGPFVDIVGAGGPTYAATHAGAFTRHYRRMIICTATNDTAYSTVLAATTNLCYCAATQTPGTTTGFYISRVSIDAGGLDNSSTVSVGPGSGYSDYTAFPGNVMQGAPYWINIYSGTANSVSVAGVWVDWNGDGDFIDVNEPIGAVYVPGAGGVGHLLINVPAGATLGCTRMRVRMISDDTGTWGFVDPCATTPAAQYDHGETEDYNLCVSVNSCVNASQGGFISSVSPFPMTVNDALFPAISGVQGTIIRWEFNFTDCSSFTPAQSFQSYTGAIINNVNEPFIYLRAAVQNGGCPVDFSNCVQVKVNCAPPNDFNTGDNDYIANVSLGTGGSIINNTSTYDPTFDGYQDFTQISGSPFHVQRGVAIPITITTTPFWAEGVRVWIDYNGDNAFTSSESVFSAASSIGAKSGTITIPCGTYYGQARMRVLCAYFVTPDVDPCYDPFGGTGAYGFGEIEEYMLFLDPPASQVGVSPSPVCVPANTSITATGGNGTYTWNPATGLSASTGATVQVQIIPTLTFYTVSSSDPTTLCPISSVFAAATAPVGGQATPATSVVCSGSSKLFTATGTAGAYQWQTASNPLGPWTSIAGATNSTYNLTPITATTYVRVVAQSPACWDVSSTTAVVSVSSNPVVTFTNVTASSATVNWTPYGATQYNITWTGAGGVTGNQTGAVSPFNITGLNANGNLSVTVAPVLSCPGITGTTVTTTTLCAKPTVSSVTAVVSPTGVKGLKVIWTAVAGATAYRVYYRPLVMNANWSSVDTAGGTTKTIMPLYAGVPYAVMVAANNCPGAGQLGQPSDVNYFTYTAPGLPACGPVPTITAVSNCPNQLTANLSGGTGTWRVTARRLSPSFSAGVSYTVSSPVVNLSITATPTGSVWEVFAQAVCGSSYSGLSNVEVVTVKAPCLAPQNVIVSNPDCDGFTVSWNPAVCGGLTLSNYQVYIKKSTAVNYVSYNGGSGDHKTFPYPALAPGTYTVFVRAITCNGSMSAASTVQTGVVGGPGCKTGDEETTQATEAVVAASIYPNPTAGQFSVEVTATSKAEALRIEVADALGRVVYTDLSDTEAGLPSLRVLNLPESMSAGLYTVRIAAGQNTWTERLVLQRD